MTTFGKRLAVAAAIGLVGAGVAGWSAWGGRLGPPQYEGRVAATRAWQGHPQYLVETVSGPVWVWILQGAEVRGEDGSAAEASVGDWVRAWGPNRVLTTYPPMYTARLMIVGETSR